jgi:hypothetical protein
MFVQKIRPGFFCQGRILPISVDDCWLFTIRNRPLLYGSPVRFDERICFLALIIINFQTLRSPKQG